MRLMTVLNNKSMMGIKSGLHRFGNKTEMQRVWDAQSYNELIINKEDVAALVPFVTSEEEVVF